jgi:hydroxymethylglutaryl-CoA reductase (NADPH)
MMDAGRFVAWVCDHEPRLAAAAEATTRHGRLIQIEPHMLGETVYLVCRYETGDAAGQNMVTIATDALCRVIEDACPVRPRHWFLEANFSGDKKASYLAVLTGRGRKVSVSATIPADLIRRRLHTDIPTMLAYGRLANLGALASGTVGAHGHIANGLAALYLATGQDVACVAESAVGFLRMDAVAPGEGSERAERAAARDAAPAAAGAEPVGATPAEPALHVTLTLPNVVVGTVGGGTGLPSQAAALDILGLRGDGKADALAEVAAALCLAGEVSIIGALAAGDFANAHARLARGRRPHGHDGPDGPGPDGGR